MSDPTQPVNLAQRFAVSSPVKAIKKLISKPEPVAQKPIGLDQLKKAYIQHGMNEGQVSIQADGVISAGRIFAFLHNPATVLTDEEASAIANVVMNGFIVKGGTLVRGNYVKPAVPDQTATGGVQARRIPPSVKEQPRGTEGFPKPHAPTATRHEASVIYNILRHLDPDEPVSLRSIRDGMRQGLDWKHGPTGNSSYESDRIGHLVQILLDNKVLFLAPDAKRPGASLVRLDLVGLEWLARFV